MKYIERKTLLYKTGVEYGDYTVNHVEGCAHGCLFPCYAFMMGKRFGRVKDYKDWLEPKLVINACELLRNEIIKEKGKIKFVHFCFTTDPFMLGNDEISQMTLKLIKIVNETGIKCTLLTKGILPDELSQYDINNEIGITLVSLNEEFRKQYEPFTSKYDDRIESLKRMKDYGLKTWVSIEPYPTPNIVNQELIDVLESISFVDKIIFGRMNYNKLVSVYKNYKDFYNMLSQQVISFCEQRNIEYYIKKGTITEF